MLLLALLSLTQISPEAVRLLREERPREAAAVMEAQLATTPDDGELRHALVTCQLGLKAYARALEHMPAGDGDFDAARGRALFALGRYESALEFLAPTAPETTLLHADALEALGRMEEADRAVAAAREALGPEHPAVLVLDGRRLARAGDHAGAALRFQEARERDRWSPAALFGLGRALIHSGRRDEGLAVLEEHRRLLPLLDRLEFALAGLALDPAHAPNHAALGDVERALGRTDRALAAYARASERATPEQLVPVALRWSRALAEDRDDREQALGVLRAARSRGGDPLRLRVREGDLLEELGRVEEARSAWRAALRLRPGDPALLERLRRTEPGGR